MPYLPSSRRGKFGQHNKNTYVVYCPAEGFFFDRKSCFRGGATSTTSICSKHQLEMAFLFDNVLDVSISQPIQLVATMTAAGTAACMLCYVQTPRKRVTFLVTQNFKLVGSRPTG